MGKIECEICEKEFTSILGLSKHNSQKHHMCAEETYIEYELKGIKPTCKCGCGEEVNFLSIKKGYVEFVRGHASRINNNWGHNLKAMEKSKETQRLMHESGDLKMWNDGLTIDDPRVRDNIDKVMANPNRSKKISDALSDVPKSEEHKQKLSNIANIRWSDPKEREAQRFRRLKYFRTSQSRKRSKLEQFFDDLLTNMGIKFESSYSVDGYLYDFYISEYNTLIEVDGDWYHFNENVHSLPLSPIQKNTIQNDKKKNKVAKSNNITLLRFWEYDINNNLDDVITKLKEFL
jgi:very-short-patch-repair endonuclease